MERPRYTRIYAQKWNIKMRTLSKKDAQRMADNIKKYWYGEGYSVHAYAVKATRDPRSSDWAVRSDLLNGFPRYAKHGAIQ